MRNILLLALNTLKITFRKKSNIIVFILIPIITTIVSMKLYSSAGSGKTQIGILNKDKGIFSKNLISSIEKKEGFKVQMVKEKDIKDKVSTGKLDCAIVIPETFTESIYSNSFKELEIMSIKGEGSTAWIQNYVNYYIKNLLDISKASSGNKEVFNKMYEGYKNSDLKLKVEKVEDNTLGKMVTVTSLGFLLMFIMIGTNTTSTLMLKERKNRTYYRICSSPVSSRNYLLGNVLANLLIVIVQSCIVVLVATKVLKINTYVPSYLLIGILTIFGLVSIAIGVLIVSLSNSTVQSGYMATLIITPTCMLGGCFWPIDLMPDTMKAISDFVPQKWALDAISKIQQGGNIYDIRLNIAILLGFIAAFFLIAIYNLNHKEKVRNFV